MLGQLSSGAKGLIYDLSPLSTSWADPEGDRGSESPLENHKAQCWANIGLPAKCHLNGISLAGR